MNNHNTFKYLELQINAFGYYVEAIILTIQYYMAQAPVKHATQELTDCLIARAEFDDKHTGTLSTLSSTLEYMQLQRAVQIAQIHSTNCNNVSQRLLRELMFANSAYANAIEDILICIDTSTNTSTR